LKLIFQICFSLPQGHPGVFVSAIVSILIFLGQTVLACHSYNGGIWSPPQRACIEKFKLNMILMIRKCKDTLMA